MPSPKKRPTSGPANEGLSLGPPGSPGLARDTPITVVDPFTMAASVRRLDSILEGRTFANPEEEAAFLAEVVAGRTNLRPVSADPNTPLGKAQSLVYDALKADDPRKREQLAKRALRISKDCADAWVLLAQETAEDAHAAATLYEEGVRAGERALGEAAFAEHTGNFWSVLETRPYMRARQGLALALWEMGEFDEAVAHLQAMIDLNPTDNQGIRHVLITALLDRGQDRDAGLLLNRYADDDTAIWLYSRTLWRFRKDGPGRRTSAILQEAMSLNPFVLDYLLGASSLPRELPEFAGIGGETEAIVYFQAGITGWLRTPGAIDWVRTSATR